MTFSTQFSSTVGPLTLEGDDLRLTRLGFGSPSVPQGDAASLSAAAIQLEQYFAGQRTSFSLELSLDGTEFERRGGGGGGAVSHRPAAPAGRDRRPGRPAGVGRGERDSLRLDGLVRRDRRADRAAGGVPCGGQGERSQPDRRGGSVPPGRRLRRIADRLRGRHRDEARAARAGGARAGYEG